MHIWTQAKYFWNQGLAEPLCHQLVTFARLFVTRGPPLMDKLFGSASKRLAQL